MQIILLSFSLCALLNAPPSLSDSNLVNVDGSYSSFDPLPPDDIFLSEENQRAAVPLLLDPTIYQQNTDEAPGDEGSQNIPIDATIAYKVATLEGVGISTEPGGSTDPSLDGTIISGNNEPAAFPWNEAFPLDQAFPPLKQVIPLDSIFGVQDDSEGKCRDKPGPWPLCCTGKWEGGGQRNVENCDLCRLPSLTCCCVVDNVLSNREIHSLFKRQLLIHVGAQMTLW